MISFTVMPVGCDGSSGPSPRSASTGMARHKASRAGKIDARKARNRWCFINNLVTHSIRYRQPPRNRRLGRPGCARFKVLLVTGAGDFLLDDLAPLPFNMDETCECPN